MLAADLMLGYQLSPDQHGGRSLHLLPQSSCHQLLDSEGKMGSDLQISNIGDLLLFVLLNNSFSGITLLYPTHIP